MIILLPWQSHTVSANPKTQNSNFRLTSGFGRLAKHLQIRHIHTNMSPTKIMKDWLFKAYFQSHKVVPSGLVELAKYFRNNDPIKFTYHNEEGLIVAVSANYRYGSIVTFAENEKELDEKIKDAILTSFGIPSSYAKEASIHRKGDARQMAYAAT